MTVDGDGKAAGRSQGVQPLTTRGKRLRPKA